MADRKKPKGWVKEPVRHGLSAKGVKTKFRTKSNPKLVPVSLRMPSPEVPLPSTRAMRRKEAEQILFRIRRKHISPEQFMDLTGELHTFAEQFPDDSDEYIVLRARVDFRATPR